MSPSAGYQPDDFDRYFTDASQSTLLGDMFGQHFDASTPPAMRGFCFITMSGFEHMAAMLADAPSGPMLDAACGRGGPGRWLAQQVGRSLHGIDISSVAIAQARSHAEDLGGRATYAVGPLDDIDADDGSSAAVICLDALHFPPEPLVAAQELARVTMPGGMLIATAWRTADGPPRLRHDIPTILSEAGWSVDAIEGQPDWLEAQRRLYAAAMAEPSWTDPAMQRLRDEGEAVSGALRDGERLLIRAHRA